MMTDEFIRALYEFAVLYDKENGVYPENEWEGLSFYQFVCGELDIDPHILMPANPPPGEYGKKYWENST